MATYTCTSASCSLSSTSSSTSSCDLTVAHRVWRNPLIRLSTGILGLESSEKYNLNQLLNVDDPRCGSEEAVKNWLEPKLSLPNTTIQVLCKHNYYMKLSKVLAPFLSSLAIKPDFAMVVRGFLVLIVEVHSKNYDDTLAKAAANTLDQLRFLRLYCPGVSTLSSFVFPQFSRKFRGSKNEECVTRVDVKWERMTFCITFQYVAMSSVEAEVKHVFEEQSKHIPSHNVESGFGDCGAFFMALSDDDLAFFKECVLSEHPLKQINSKHLIIAVEYPEHKSHSEVKVYKIIPSASEYLFRFLMKKDWKKWNKKVSYLGIPEEVRYIPQSKTPVFVSDKLPEPPLSKQEAIECLFDLISQVADALHELHDLGYAHLDVRLPNICFTRDGMVKLIDFDRILPSSYPPPMEFQSSFMYCCHIDNCCEDLDWKQLGLMVYSILHPEIHQTDIKEKDVSSLPGGFLYNMIFSCRYNKSELDLWKKDLDQGLHSVRD